MTSPGRAILVLALGLLVLAFPYTSPYGQTASADSTFAQVRELRAQGDFEQAIGLLSGVIKEYSHSEPVLRKAHNDLVFTYLSQRNATADSTLQADHYTRMIESADAALLRFPDLQASTQEYPPEVGLIYDTRRALLFGRVEVTTGADSSRVFLRTQDGKEVYQGITPLVIPYVPVGDYTLTVTRIDYNDREVPLSVGPSAIVQREVTLPKERTKKWWLTRVVAPVAAGTAAIIAIVIGSQDDSTNDPTQPLDEPPPPPATNKR